MHESIAKEQTIQTKKDLIFGLCKRAWMHFFVFFFLPSHFLIRRKEEVQVEEEEEEDKEAKLMN